MNVTLGSAIPNATRYIYTGYLGIQQQLLQALSEYSSMKLLKIRHKWSVVTILFYSVNLNLPKERSRIQLQFTTTNFPAVSIINCTSFWMCNLVRKSKEWLNIFPGFQYVMAAYFPLIFGYSLQQAVILIVTEKQKKLKIVMAMMGMRVLSNNTIQTKPNKKRVNCLWLNSIISNNLCNRQVRIGSVGSLLRQQSIS